MERVSKLQAAFAGVAAVVVGFAITYPLRVVTRAPFLPEISAQLAVEYSPSGLTRFIIDRFGTGDKAVGTAIAFTAYFIAGIVFGLIFLRTRNRLPGESAAAKGLSFMPVTLIPTTVFAVVLLWLRPAIWAGYAVTASAFSLIVFNLAFAIVLGLLIGTGEETSESSAAQVFARRRALFVLGTITAAAVLTDSILRRLYTSYTQAVGAPSGKTPPFITSNADFYQISKDLANPRVDEKKWKLSIRGNVEHPFELSYQELLALPMVERTMTLECVSNEIGGPLISNARWRGVPLKILLTRAGQRSDTQEIVLRAVDDYSDSIPLTLALADDTIVALFMNGEKLPVDHGAPARLLVPGLFGMENVKWLAGIEPITGHHTGYWQQRGWEKFAGVNTMSKFFLPSNGAQFAVNQPIELAGVAFAGNRGIRAVEIAVIPVSHAEITQPATWSKAELSPGGSQITWSFWKSTWTAKQTGNYALMVRATDGTGSLQTPRRAPPFPNGATGYHTIQVHVSA